VRLDAPSFAAIEPRFVTLSRALAIGAERDRAPALRRQGGGERFRLGERVAGVDRDREALGRERLDLACQRPDLPLDELEHDLGS